MDSLHTASIQRYRPVVESRGRTTLLRLAGGQTGMEESARNDAYVDGDLFHILGSGSRSILTLQSMKTVPRAPLYVSGLRVEVNYNVWNCFRDNDILLTPENAEDRSFDGTSRKKQEASCGGRVRVMKVKID
ncbi:hypothetical protein SUGI_0583460 [Cryptomeria japonica]|nr:hypothetical protein SUGI_0583460 [Cryptomeria japonica]